MSPRQIEGIAQAASIRVAVAVSRYNTSITQNLLQGCLQTLAERGVPDESVDVAWVPGAWELPLVTQRLAESTRYQAVVCLGAVIRGETTHDEHINRQVSHSLGQLALQYRIPVIFGVLTCQSVEQAHARSGGRHGNKGSECALTALEMIDLLRQLT